jgi:hypothetical protein
VPDRKPVFLFIMKEEKVTTIVDGQEHVEIKKRKSPVPADIDRIKAGALKMPLAARIELSKALNESITKEIQHMETQLNGAKEHFK